MPLLARARGKRSSVLWVQPPGWALLQRRANARTSVHVLWCGGATVDGQISDDGDPQKGSSNSDCQL